MGKNRGQVRNRARDMLCDYYVTNEEARSCNKSRQKQGDRDKGLRNLSRSEKIYMCIILMGLTGIVVKYF